MRIMHYAHHLRFRDADYSDWGPTQQYFVFLVFVIFDHLGVN